MTTTSLTPFSALINSVFAPTTCAADGEARAVRLTPRADILEGDSDFIIRMDLPGVNRDDLNVELDGETLTIKAERRGGTDDGYRALRNERAAGARFERTFQLGRGVDRDNVSALMTDGVLTVVLPKNEQAVSRRIEVK